MNDNALDLAFVSDKAVLDTTLSEVNVFENQNAAYSAVLGREERVLNA